MTLLAYIRLLRPHQWLKNLMIFFPPFLSGSVLPAAMLSRGLAPFAAFCLASSANYLFNDLIDQSKDMAHPVKSRRPLPAGLVLRPVVMILCGILAAAAVIVGVNVSSDFLVFVVLYLILSATYSLILKHSPVIDVFCIAFGFVLRLYGGGEAFAVQISDWLFLSVFLLATFLGFGKRYSERNSLGANAATHRPALMDYPDGYLESTLYLSGSAVLVTYAIYAISKPPMVYTVPLCMFGLLRYLLRIKSGESGDPTDALLRDVPLLVTGVLWVLLVGWCVYL